jgi:hypothetical protein
MGQNLYLTREQWQEIGDRMSLEMCPTFAATARYQPDENVIDSGADDGCVAVYCDTPTLILFLTHLTHVVAPTNPLELLVKLAEQVRGSMWMGATTWVLPNVRVP